MKFYLRVVNEKTTVETYKINCENTAVIMLPC